MYTQLAHVSLAGLSNGSSDEDEFGLFELYRVAKSRPTGTTTDSEGREVPYVENENLFRSDTVPWYMDATHCVNSTWWYYKQPASAPTNFVRLENVSLTSGNQLCVFFLDPY